MRDRQVLGILRVLAGSDGIEARKIGGEFSRNLDDRLLGGQLVLVAEHILEADVVLVEQGLHPGPVLSSESDAQGREDISHNLKSWINTDIDSNH